MQKLVVEIAVKRCTNFRILDALWAIGYWILVIWINPVAFYAVDSKALVSIADAVAIVKGDTMSELYADGIMAGGNDLTNLLTCGFWRLPVSHVGCTTMQKIVGLSTMERLGGVRGETILIYRACGGMFERGSVGYQLIQQLSVICHDIGDIIAVF